MLNKDCLCSYKINNYSYKIGLSFLCWSIWFSSSYEITFYFHMHLLLFYIIFIWTLFFFFWNWAFVLYWTFSALKKKNSGSDTFFCQKTKRGTCDSDLMLLATHMVSSIYYWNLFHSQTCWRKGRKPFSSSVSGVSCSSLEPCIASCQ